MSIMKLKHNVAGPRARAGLVFCPEALTKRSVDGLSFRIAASRDCFVKTSETLQALRDLAVFVEVASQDFSSNVFVAREGLSGLA